jgi:hypothetical protein
MLRTVVDSSSVRSVNYDRTARILEVEFRHGSIYRYFDVPAAEHADLMRAPSLGRYLSDRIRDRYRYERL